MKAFYVTTPIYYVNDRPHIGHAYSTIAADVLARYHSLRGRPTRMLTGTDEHGQKIERRAKEEGLDPQKFVDGMAPPFREAFDELNCRYDDFIRTTEKRHEDRAKILWKKLQEAGDIYLGEYEGWYSVSSEAFYTEKDLLEGHLDPITRKPCEKVREKSYFFRLSDYTDKLLAFYETHPHFVQPEGRFNEVKSFVRDGLRDLSISRTTFRWGIPVPGDPEHVMYVWLDALTNYISALGGPADKGEEPLYDQFWPPASDAIHIVGKDILRFHAIYWPAFLLSAGLEPPTQVWAHGWLTVDGVKMSKSLKNFIPPGPLVQAFGPDPLRYYLMRDVAFGHDGDFSHRGMMGRYNGELANGLGNLVNRLVATIVKKHLGSKVPAVPSTVCAEAHELIATAKKVSAEAAAYLEGVAPHRALDRINELMAAANRYVDRTEPWKLAKEGKLDALGEVSYTALEAIRWLGVMLWPFMPSKCDELRQQLGLGSLMPTEYLDLWPHEWGGLRADQPVRPASPLFPRLDDMQQKHILQELGVTEQPTQQTGDGQKKSSGEAAAITIDDFAKIDLRLGVVKSAEAVPKSKKLLKLQIDLGEAHPRQILSGISAHYQPDELVGRKVAVVANLPPRKMMGLESHGMVLAVSDVQGLALLSPERDIKVGSRIT